jgi:hypothetical protein
MGCRLIDRLRELYQQGRFEARRFRPNIVVSTGSEDTSGSAVSSSATLFAWPSPNHVPVA